MNDPIRAILFDLDGTLLGSNMDVFLPHYFKTLSARVAHIVPPDEFVSHLMWASNVGVGKDGQQGFWPTH